MPDKSNTFELPYTLPRVYETPFDMSIDLNRIIAINIPYYVSCYYFPYIVLTIIVDGKDKPIEHYHRVEYIAGSDDILIHNKTLNTVYPKNWREVNADEEPYEMEDFRKLVDQLILKWRGF